MLSHIRDAKTPKEAWESLRKIFVANRSAQKLQHRQELNNIRQKDMSMSDYTVKIKSICDSLGSIIINVDEDEMVQVCLGRLAQRFDPIRTTLLAREKRSSFLDLQSMVLVEENHVRTKSKTLEGQMFFSNLDGGHGRGRSSRRCRFAQGKGGRFGPSHKGTSNLQQEDGNT